MIFYRIQLKNPETNEVFFEHVGKKIKLPSIEYCQDYPFAMIYIDQVSTQVTKVNADNKDHDKEKPKVA